MRRRISLVLTLAAWLLATGSHWDLVQTFAWGRMIATSAQSMPLLSAVKRTFTPEARCDLCYVVADAKQQGTTDSSAAGAKTFGKILLVCAPTAVQAYSPERYCVGLATSAPAPASLSRGAPPSPPPRGLS